MKRNARSKNSYPIRERIDTVRRDDNLMGFEKWREIGETVKEELKRLGQFFNTPQGLFFFDSEHRQAFSLHQDIGLAAIVNQRYGINPGEHGFKRILSDLQSEAFLNGRKLEIRRLAHYDSATKRLYVSRFDGEMYRLDGDSIHLVPNGTDDVFFFDERLAWEPYRYAAGMSRGEFDRQLIDSVNFDDSLLSPAEQRILLKLWIAATFFGSMQPTKIILLLLGHHGSGKTSALRRIQKFIFGQKADLLSIEKQKQDGFIATVTTDPLALFDNLDEQVGWLPYALSRLATGVTFSRRQLYTTNSKAEFPGVSWLGITARTVGFMQNQPDLPERTLVLKVGQLGEKRPEGELLAAVAEHRNAIWSEFLDELNKIVRHLRQSTERVRVRFRMADFASFALQAGMVWGCRAKVEQALGKLEHAQADLVFEDEPIHQVLDIWLVDNSNHARSEDAGALHREWSAVAREHRINWPFENGRSLGQRLGQLRSALEERFEVEVTWNAHAKQNHYRFWPKGASCEEFELANVAYSAELSGAAASAGFAGMLLG
jgi:hypothetical protein